MRTALKRGITMASFVSVCSVVSSIVMANEVNIYSARHYQTDQALYDDFTQNTGIEINLIEAKADALIERIKREGVNSPADIFISVDAGRLWRAEQADILDSVESEILFERLPDHLRHPDGKWFGLSKRARVFVYNTERVSADQAPKNYADLTRPEWQNRICIRSSSNVYNMSLLASIIAHHGLDEAQRWADGVVANFARKPQGGDTDQIRAVAAGECDVAVANTYYYARLIASDKQADKDVIAKTDIIFPDQDGRGAHVNISGAGVVKGAPNKGNAIAFLEYMTSDSAQRHFAGANHEYPAVKGVSQTNAVVKMGTFKIDTVNASVYGTNQPKAVMVFDIAGWP
jgi:iron(III) transport system substrate-binding protein